MPKLVDDIVPTLVTNVLEHLAIRYASDTPLEGPLKALGFLPENSEDQLGRLLASSLETFFERHPEYQVHGTADFFIKPAMSHIIVSQLSTGEALDSSRIEELYKEHLNKDYEARHAFHGAFLDVSTLVANFLACFLEVLASHQTADGVLTRMEIRQSEERIIRRFQSQPSHSPKNDYSDAFLEEAIKHLGKLVISDAHKLLEAIRADWEAGRVKQAISAIREFRSDFARWAVLKNEDKAEHLRTEAALRLYAGESLADVQELIEDAHQISPNTHGNFLNAFIAYREGDREKALEILEDPRDHLSRNLKAGILLELDRLDEAEVILNGVTSPNPNTLRLKTLIALARRNLGEARISIEQATKLAPDSHDIRFVSAQVRFFESIALYALPEHPQTFPEPTSLSIVKGDSASLAQLREAETIFSSLAAEAREPIRSFARVWRLACLANDPARRDEAVEYCQKLLQDEPAQPAVIIWGIMRHLEVDVENCKQALRQAIGTKSVSIERVLALAQCLQASGDYQGTLELLQNHEQLFRQNHLAEVWIFNCVVALVRIGDFDQAKVLLEEANGLDKPAYQLESLILEAEAQKTGHWKDLLQYLEEAYSVTHDTVFLLMVCEIKHRLADWDGVLDIIDTMLEAGPTDDIFRMALNAAWMSRRLEQCLQLIEDYRLFQGTLSDDIRRVRVDCLYGIGAFKEALTEAQILKEGSPTAPNLLFFADTAIKTGALHTALMLAAEFENRSDVGAWPKLNISRIIAGKDLELARRLWRQAMENLPTEALLNALMVAHALGLKEETAPIFERLQQFPAELEGQVHWGPVEDLISIRQQVHEERTEAFEQYSSGILPVHLFVSRSHVTLAELFHLNLARNEVNPQPLSQFALYTQHGGRPEVQGMSVENLKGKLHLDISAVLLAAHLELLDKIQAQFAPLIIPAELIPQLVETYYRLKEKDLARLRACQQIVKQANEGSLTIDSLNWNNEADSSLVFQLGQEWAVQYESAREENGYFVNFLPLRKRGLTEEPAEISQEVSGRLLDLHSILDALYQPYGLLTYEQYQQKFHELGDRGLWTVQSLPQRGDVLYFYANTLEVLAEVELLWPASQVFDIHISQQQLDEAKEYINQDIEAENLANWVYDLIGDMHRGVMVGTYVVLPHHAVETQHQDVGGSNLGLECLQSLLSVVARSGTVVWIDDRYANAITGPNGPWILSILDILRILLSEKLLTEDAYYQYLRRLRAANVRFLPLTSQEILYHLTAAPINRTHVSFVDETPALRILRQYVGACMSQSDVLQVPRAENKALNKDGEILYIIQLYRAVLEAMLRLWQDTHDVEDAQVRSEWMLNSIQVDYVALIQQDAGTQTRTAQFTPLILGGLALGDRTLGNSASTLRRSFLSWLWVRVLQPHLASQPSLMTELVTKLKEYLLQLRHNGIEGVPPELIGLGLHHVLEDVPSAIREVILEDKSFVEEIGLDFVLTFGDVQIARKPLLEAATLAANGVPATVRTVTGEEIQLVPVEKDSDHFTIDLVHSETGTRIAELPPTYQLLSTNGAYCRGLLAANRTTFDMPDADFEQYIESIIRTEPKERFEEVEHTLEETALVFYQDIHQRLASGHAVSFEGLFALKSRSLLRFLRFENREELSFAQNIERAAKSLTEEFGVWQALWRFSCLPVALPDSLLAAIADLDSTERSEIIERFVPVAISPTAKLHLIYLLNAFEDGHVQFDKLTNWIVSEDGRQYFSAFLSVLRWVSDEFERRPDIYRLSTPLQLGLIWLHANHIFSIFVSAHKATGHDDQVDFVTFAEQFMSHRPKLLRKFFEEDDLSLDVSYPGRVSYPTFLLAGLGYATQGKAFGADTVITEIKARLAPESPVLWALSRSLQPTVTRAPNTMGSFLGEETFSLVQALFNEVDTEEKPIGAQEIIEQTLSMLENENSPENWLQLHMLLGDWPLLGEYKERFVRIVLETNFADMFGVNPTSGYVAFSTAATQARYISDERIVVHLRNQIVRIAQNVAFVEHRVMYRGDHEEIPRTEVLVNLIAKLSRAYTLQDQADSAISNYIDLVKEAVLNCPGLGFDALRFSVRLYDELPTSQAQLLMPLILWLRAFSPG